MCARMLCLRGDWNNCYCPLLTTGNLSRGRYIDPTPMVETEAEECYYILVIVIDCLFFTHACMSECQVDLAHPGETGILEQKHHSETDPMAIT